MPAERAAEVAERFGDNLRRVRRRKGLSQDRLAKRASMHPTAIGLLERGDRACRIDTLIRLAGALEVRPEELLDGIDWIPAPQTDGSFAIGTSPISPRPVKEEPRR